MSWRNVDPIRGEKGEKGASHNRRMNEARARGWTKGTIRKKCLTIGADHQLVRTSLKERSWLINNRLYILWHANQRIEETLNKPLVSCPVRWNTFADSRTTARRRAMCLRSDDCFQNGAVTTLFSFEGPQGCWPGHWSAWRTMGVLLAQCRCGGRFTRCRELTQSVVLPRC